MKNRLEHLNNHLFASLERLGDEDLTEEQIQAEAVRAKAISDTANQILQGGKLALDAAKLVHEVNGEKVDVDGLLERKSGD